MAIADRWHDAWGLGAGALVPIAASFVPSGILPDSDGALTESILRRGGCTVSTVLGKRGQRRFRWVARAIALGMFVTAVVLMVTVPQVPYAFGFASYAGRWHIAWPLGLGAMVLGLASFAPPLFFRRAWGRVDVRIRVVPLFVFCPVVFAVLAYVAHFVVWRFFAYQVGFEVFRAERTTWEVGGAITGLLLACVLNLVSMVRRHPLVVAALMAEVFGLIPGGGRRRTQRPST